MNYTHSTPRQRKSKQGSAKRPDGFPLFFHKGSGQWAKKVRGKRFYFGTDQQNALDKWLAQKDDLLAGRTPRNHDPDAMTVADAGELFLQSRERRVQTGEMSDKTLASYVIIIKKAVKILGENLAVEQLRPDDFARLRSKLAKGKKKTVNLKSLEGFVATVRAMFHHVDKNGLLNTSLNKLWGTEFNKPGRKDLTKLRNKTKRLFSASEINELLMLAGVPMKAMILLGVNCGFGNTDVSRVEFSSIDFESGFIELDRSKTGKARRCPLWPETASALQKAIAKRPKPKAKEDESLIFITKSGGNWIPCTKDNPVAKEFAKLAKLAGFETSTGKSFYTLRHTFQTVGDETKDFVAVSSIMGHSGTSISDHYRETISDERLKAVADHVRSWLFPTPVKRKQGAKKQAKTIVGRTV